MYHAAGPLSPFVAAYSDKSLDFVERYGWTQMSMLYAETTNQMISDQGGNAVVRGELVRLWSEISKLKGVVKKTFALYCSSGLIRLNYHSLNPPVENVTRLERSSSMVARMFGHNHVLMKKSCKMRSRRLLTRMRKTVENMSGALGSVQRFESQVHGVAVDPSLLGKRQCVQGDGAYFVLDGV